MRAIDYLKRIKELDERTSPGSGEISTGKAPRERRGGHACKIAKLKVKILTI